MSVTLLVELRKHPNIMSLCLYAALQTQPLTPTGRPHFKKGNSEEIQDDFDWDSLIE